MLQIMHQNGLLHPEGMHLEHPERLHLELTKNTNGLLPCFLVSLGGDCGFFFYFPD